MIIQATYLNDAPEKNAENVLIGGVDVTGEAVKSVEADRIAEGMKRGESARLAVERTESAAAARTAATSRLIKDPGLSQSPQRTQRVLDRINRIYRMFAQATVSSLGMS